MQNIKNYRTVRPIYRSNECFLFRVFMVKTSHENSNDINISPLVPGIFTQFPDRFT